jgi:hypothetical protein
MLTSGKVNAESDRLGVLGATTFGSLSATGAPWSLGDPGTGIGLDTGSGLTFSPTGGTCFLAWQVDAVTTETLLSVGPSITDSVLQTLGSGRDIGGTATLVGPSDGEQILRFRAYLWTNDKGLAFEDRYYHLFVALPLPAPAAPPYAQKPGVPCGTLDSARSAPPALALAHDSALVQDGQIGAFTWNGGSSTDQADVIPDQSATVKVGTALRMLTGSDACAGAWSIVYGPIPSGFSSPLTLVPAGSLIATETGKRKGTGFDLPFAAQNRFGLTSLPVGEWIIRATLQFNEGTSAYFYRIVVTS